MQKSKTSKKISILLYALLSFTVMKAQTPGTTSVNPIVVTAGTSSLINQSPDSTTKWYKITPTQPNILLSSLLTVQSFTNSFVSAEVFITNGSGTVLRSYRDSLRTNNTTVFNFNGFDISNRIYLKFNFNNSCGTCTATPTKFNIYITEGANDLARCLATPLGCNIVKNPSFENFYAPCANLGLTAAGFVPPVCEWQIPSNCSFPGNFSLTGTPDYINACGTATNYFYGYNFLTPSNTGSGHIGLFIFAWNSFSLNPGNNGSYREYITQPLNAPLIPSKTYQLSLYTKAAFKEYFAKDVSVFLSNTTPCQPGINNINTTTLTGQQLDISSSVITNTVWQKFLVTFTATGNYDKLTIGNFRDDASTTWIANTSTAVPYGNSNAYYFIDDVSLITPSVTLSSPVTATCGIPFQFNPSVCEFDNSTTSYSYSWSPSTGLSNPNILNPIVTLSSPIIYTLTQTGTNTLSTIVNTATVSVNITIPSVTVSATTNQTFVCSNTGQSSTLIATSNGSPTYSWQPGSLTGSSPVVSPTVTTTYTLFATQGGCTNSQTVNILVSNSCCTSTIPAFVGTAFPTNTLGNISYTSPLVFNNNVTIPASMTVALNNSQFLFAPGVSLIVSGGARLDISTSHLYACGTTMWQGIVINDGGMARSTKQNLIEDAIVAFDITANTTSTVTPYILQVVNTVFNKNYIGIKVDGYQRTFSPYPISVISSVFSSRNFTFSPTTWPYANTTDLRSATNPTTGLAAPYLLQSAALVNLKAPYSAQPAFAGISLNNVGITNSNFYGITIGDPTNASEFNLFDDLMYGIDATNSNVNSLNNVYQNTQRLLICTPRCRYNGGSAIRHSVYSLLNAKLNLTATGSFSTSPSVGNRFWDCHRGVEGLYTYQFNCEYATFRSSQSTVNGNVMLPGNTGITIQTNRFNYYIRNNEFSNINNAIGQSIFTGNYDVGAGTQNGIYANNNLINNNFFGPVTNSLSSVTTQYLNNAIYVGGTNSVAWQTVAGTKLYVENNNFNRVYRGAYLSGMNGYPISVANNKVKVADDNFTSATQHGIDLTNTLGNAIVTTNTLSGTGVTNTLTTLVFSGSNAGTNSPSVTCNDLSNSYQGFEFNSVNSGTTKWMGNKMQTHTRGFVLSNNGIIGTQGSAGNPIDNLWNGAWGIGTFCTWTADPSTFASNSLLWVKNIGILPNGPINNNGSPTSQSYNSGFINNTTGTFYCTGGPPPPQNMMASSGSSSQVLLLSNDPSLSDEKKYIADNNRYRYLAANPAIKNNNATYNSFYNGKANSSLDKFLQVENYIYNGQYSQAQLINNAVAVTNAVEANYKTFYSLYSKHATGNFTVPDSLTLINLAKLCSGIDGAVVYQARALYNLIYKTVKNYKENCDEVIISGSRFNSIGNNENSGSTKNNWTVDLFPNPASNEFNIVSNAESENLTVIIRDVAGKILYNQRLRTSNFISKLDLNLINGIYFVTINNTNNESTTKKLVIAK
ncbi:MAG: T9SS type A sorting domain-containing protein [Bacteroidetes bacterium]|nr:T9SS type A sorting domain-containing protein [Bacteroidota bacterium]